MTTEYNELYDYDITYDSDEVRKTVVESAVLRISPTVIFHLITVTDPTTAAATHTINLINGDTVSIW